MSDSNRKRRTGRVPLIIVAIVALAAILVPLLLHWTHSAIDWDAVRAPLFAPGHLFGTDAVGRDLLARTLVGTRVTLAVALAAALVALTIGTAWGAIAGLAWIRPTFPSAIPSRPTSTCSLFKTSILKNTPT